MISEGMLKIISLLNIATILFCFFKSYYETIKSKNYKNTKKLFALQIIMFMAIEFNWFFSIELGGKVYGTGLGFLIHMFISIPLLLVILINSLILLIVMKKKKYNLNNSISFKKRIAIILAVLIVSWGSTYLYAHTKINRSAKNYYEQKYNEKVKVVDYETILEDESTLDRVSKEGILFVLDNGDKVYYDFSDRKYYDNKQSEEIKNLINTYYEDELANLIKEFKQENEDFDYLVSQGYDEIDRIELYSHIVNADKYDEYKYYSHNEFYFNKYYEINSNDLDRTIVNIFDSGEIHLSAGIYINILCDKNGNWQQIIDEFVSDFKLDIDIELYDINSVNEQVIKNHKLKYSDEAFAQYYFKDGEYVLKK